MNSLVAYESSDDEDEARPQKPAKIAKTVTSETPQRNETQSAQPLAPENRTDEPPAQDPRQLDNKGEQDTISGPVSGPQAGPTVQPPFTDIDESVSGPSGDYGSEPSSPYTYERQRLRQLTMPTVPNFDIPDSPPPPQTNSEEAAVLAATTKRFERFLELKKQGVHFNERLQNSSSLRNPSLLPKLMDFAGITKEDSYASSLPEGLGVPARWPEECYVESLIKQNERREKKRLAQRGRPEFVPESRSRGSGHGVERQKGRDEKG